MVVAGPVARWRFVCETVLRCLVVSLLFRPAVRSSRAPSPMLLRNSVPPLPASRNRPARLLRYAPTNTYNNYVIPGICGSVAVCSGSRYNPPVDRGMALIKALRGPVDWAVKPKPALASASAPQIKRERQAGFLHRRPRQWAPQKDSQPTLPGIIRSSADSLSGGGATHCLAFRL